MIIFFSSLLYATTLAGVTLPESITLDNNPIYLRGIGLREKYWIDIYVAGLYIPQDMITKKYSASQIISANVPKRIHTHFIFPHVPKEKMVETLNEIKSISLNLIKSSQLKVRRLLFPKKPALNKMKERKKNCDE